MASEKGAEKREERRGENGIPSALTISRPMPPLAPVTSALLPLKEQPVKRFISSTLEPF